MNDREIGKVENLKDSKEKHIQGDWKVIPI